MGLRVWENVTIYFRRRKIKSKTLKCRGSEGSGGFLGLCRGLESIVAITILSTLRHNPKKPLLPSLPLHFKVLFLCFLEKAC